MSLTLTRNPNPNPQTEPNDGAPTDGTPGAPSVASRAAPVFDLDALLERFIGWWKIDRDHWQEWRQEAAECFDFRAGHQWTDEDLQILRDQMRPAITFNRIDPFMDAVSGLEINNRQETQYSPRQLGAAGVNDVLTAAAQWIRQECDAEDEETEMFLDCVTCGVGCTQSRMDYDIDPDGVARIDRIDPLRIYPDAGSKKQNFADARRITVVCDVSIDEATEMFPDVAEQDLDAQWARDEPDETRQPHNARIAPYYRIDQAGQIDRETKTVRLVETEWWQFESAWRVLNTQTGRFVLLDEKQATRYVTISRLMGQQPVMFEARQPRYYKAISGARVLKVMRGAEKGGFSYKMMTGKRDQIKGTWYGLVRAMRDPQMWSNKWLSQGLHILNTNAKGGYFAETDVFADIDEARDSLAEADSIVEVNPGKLDAIKEKNPPAFPQQLNNMTQMAIDAIPMVSGINMELMGQSTSQQPQVALLEAGRRQQSMNVLAGLFNAKRRYQKEQGRLLLWMIQTYIADGRLIRIGGPENARYVPLIHEPGVAEYDVIVEDAPTSTNMKDRVWAALMQLFPMLRGMPIPPAFYVNALKYAPVPQSFITESQQILSQPPPPNPLMQGKEAESAARARSLYAQAERHKADAQKTMMDMGQDRSLEREERIAKIEKTRADAINALQNAGLVADDTEFRRAVDAINSILAVHGAALDHHDQMHRHGMERDAAARQAQQQAQQAAQQQMIGDNGA